MSENQKQSRKRKRTQKQSEEQAKTIKSQDIESADTESEDTEFVKAPNDIPLSKEEIAELDNLYIDDEDENIIVEMTDSEGNVYLYEEEMIIPIDDKKFALLVALPYENEEKGYHYHEHHGHDHSHEHCHEHSCGCGSCDEEDVIIAKIITNEDGEEEYIEPTDEEFEMVKKAYDDFFSEDEEE